MQAIVPHASPGIPAATTSAARPRRLKITVQPKGESRSGKDEGGPSGSSGGQYCVRTCDGYYFPLPVKALPRAIRRRAELHVPARQWKSIRSATAMELRMRSR